MSSYSMSSAVSRRRASALDALVASVTAGHEFGNLGDRPEVLDLEVLDRRPGPKLLLEPQQEVHERQRIQRAGLEQIDLHRGHAHIQMRLEEAHDPTLDAHPVRHLTAPCARTRAG